MLERFRARAGELDRTNAYFARRPRRAARVGYLAAAVPAHLGGWGLDLAELAASQRRLARYAPATALAMTHALLLGRHRRRARAGRRHVAALDPRGGRRRRGLRRRPRRGRQRHPRAAVDVRRPSGSRAATASPAASSSAPTGRPGRWLGAHAIDADAPGGPQIVHAFVERDQPRRHRRRDVGHARHAADPEPRHHARRRCSSPTPASGGSSRRATAAIRSSWPWRCGRCR